MVMLLRKTSFEAVIEGFDSDAPEKWPLKGKSLPYGKLQCAMEDSCAEANAAQDNKDPASKGANLCRTQPFFSSLVEEIKLVDGHLERAALRILNLNGWTSRLRLGALRVMCRSAEERVRAKLAEEIHWCQQYAAINRIALQRLMEQYDRCSNSSAGARFLQECWSPETDLGTFLKTPLLDELHSLKLLLVGDAATKQELTHGLLASPRSSRQVAALSRSSVPAKLASKAWDTCALPAAAHAKSGPIPDIPKSCFAA